ncbi:MAG: cbb3-type cytochrome c oxidase subunit I [Leptonema sp. (in: Bacteria)]|nr:cbb3-type cytochrome c oxidase subunit I [Leptonema sp. (in: bacteria)]
MSNNEITISPTIKKLALKWIILSLVLLPILALLGILMRSVQANLWKGGGLYFYPMMTLHGVGMAGLWFVAAMVCLQGTLARYVNISVAVDRFAFWGTVIGVAVLIASVVGGFGAGWYFLYPLPFHGTWPVWATVLFFVSLTILAVTWLIWTISIMKAISEKYSFSQALGWHYIFGSGDPKVPPAVLIATVTFICVIACLASGAVVVVLFGAEFFAGTANDALLMKNLTFFFGHLLVNLAMYLGVGAVYDILPNYADRPWKTTRAVAIAWNAVLLLVLFAYFHHLYMDFVQPTALQYIGQVASYFSSIPSALVTIYGGLLLVFHGKFRWNLTSSFMFLGLLGWSIGGMGAVIDSTILVNSKLHNTLWVPAHFHTYMIMGLVLFTLGAFYHFIQELAQTPESKVLHRILTSLFVIGGYGFLLMFYMGGANSIPRRYAMYPAELTKGPVIAQIAVLFGWILFAGVIVYLFEIGRRFKKACKSD